MKIHTTNPETYKEKKVKKRKMKSLSVNREMMNKMKKRATTRIYDGSGMEDGLCV